MNTNLSGIFPLTKEPIPAHIEGLKNIHDKESYYTINDADYAKAAFALAKLADGKNSKELQIVSDYIQFQHSHIRSFEQKYIDLMNAIRSFIGWASVWTVHKDTKKE